MGISRSGMSCFISHVLDKRYDAACSQLQAMLCTSDPERQVLARGEALAMMETVATNCFEIMSGSSDGDKVSMLKFLITSYALLDQREKQLILRYELLSFLEATSVNVSGEWLSFARDCIRGGYYGNALKAYEKIKSSCPREFDSGEWRQAKELKARRDVVAEATHEAHSAVQLGRAVALLQKQMAEKRAAARNLSVNSPAASTASERYFQGIKRRHLHMYQLRKSQMK